MKACVTVPTTLLFYIVWCPRRNIWRPYNYGCTKSLLLVNAERRQELFVRLLVMVRLYYLHWQQFSSTRQHSCVKSKHEILLIHAPSDTKGAHGQVVSYVDRQRKLNNGDKLVFKPQTDAFDDYLGIGAHSNDNDAINTSQGGSSGVNTNPSESSTPKCHRIWCMEYGLYYIYTTTISSYTVSHFEYIVLESCLKQYSGLTFLSVAQKSIRRTAPSLRRVG